MQTKKLVLIPVLIALFSGCAQGYPLSKGKLEVPYSLSGRVDLKLRLKNDLGEDVFLEKIYKP